MCFARRQQRESIGGNFGNSEQSEKARMELLLELLAPIRISPELRFLPTESERLIRYEQRTREHDGHSQTI